MNNYICYNEETLDIMCYISTNDNLDILELENCFQNFENKKITKVEKFLDDYLGHKVVLDEEGKLIDIL